jgi:hypothetical protein
MQIKRIEVGISLGIVVLIGALSLSSVAVWDGGFQLTVSLHSRSAAAIKDVSFALCRDREVANQLAATTEQSAATEFRSVESAGDGRHLVRVPCSGRRWLGVDYGYIEPYRFIVLRVQPTNRALFFAVVEIPEGRGPRSITVDVP